MKELLIEGGGLGNIARGNKVSEIIDGIDIQGEVECNPKTT